MKKITTKQTGFYELFEPTADLVYDSINGNIGAETASILQSMLLAESAANCCIFSLGLNRKLENEIDKLPTIAKFDLYLLVKSAGTKQINRGDSPCQDIAELITIRNSIVHPKTYDIDREIEDDEHQTGTGYYRKSPRLKLANTCSGWTKYDALNVFKAVNRFIQYYFIEVCNHTKKETRLLLLTVPDDDSDDIFVDSARLRFLQNNHGIDLRCWGVSNGE